MEYPRVCRLEQDLDVAMSQHGRHIAGAGQTRRAAGRVRVALDEENAACVHGDSLSAAMVARAARGALRRRMSNIFYSFFVSAGTLA